VRAGFDICPEPLRAKSLAALQAAGMVSAAS
jgi:hypothetical protein